jgi:hypothetical protein
MLAGFPLPDFAAPANLRSVKESSPSANSFYRANIAAICIGVYKTNESH